MGYVVEKLYKYMDPFKAVEKLSYGLGACGVEEVDVRNSVGRVLAEDVVASRPRPWANLSHVDGYAVRSTDTKGASSTSPVRLRVVRGVDPRNAGEYRIGVGEAVFVETGYPVPEGADAVVPVESTRVIEGSIYVYRPMKSGENIVPKGSDVAGGEVIAKKGYRVTPVLQKLLIDLGIPFVKVYKKPRVAIVPTGDEVVDEVVVSPIKTPMSTAYLVKNILEYWGCSIVDTVKSRDDPGELVEIVNSLLGKTDVIATIGGVSMGPRDYTWITLYKHYKPDRYVRGLMVHPGRSTSGLRIGGKVVVNLPGLPQSTVSGLVFLLLPILLKMQGIERLKLPYLTAKLGGRVEVKQYQSFYRIRYARIDYDKMEAIVWPEIESYNVSPLLRSDGFVVIPPGTIVLEKGVSIRIYFLEPLHRYMRESVVV